MKLPRNPIALAIATSATLATSSPATTILIDLGISSQQTSLTGWNNLTGGTGNSPGAIANLDDSTGTPTTISLTYSESGADAGVAGTGANLDVPGDIANYPVTVASQPDSALRDGIFIGANDVTLTFGGLNPNATYDFLLYGGRGNNGTGATYNFTGGNTGSASISNVFGNSTEAPTVVGITPDTNNEIKLDIPNVGGSNTALNFIQVTETVTAIPEPSSLFLCGLASLALFTRRRIS